MDHIQGNKLIETFMGYRKGWNSYGQDIIVINDTPVQTQQGKKTKYHTSWDWLMPVVEKINKIAIDDYGQVEVVIYPSHCEIYTSGRELLIEVEDRSSLIYNMYLTVVAFIQWYNSNQKS